MVMQTPSLAGDVGAQAVQLAAAADAGRRADGLQNASSASPWTQTLPFGSDIGVSPQPGAQKSVPSSWLPG